MEDLLEKLFAGLGWEILVGLVSLGLGYMIRFLQNPKMRIRSSEDSSSSHTAKSTDSVDYIGASAIVNAYIAPAIQDKSPGVALTIQTDFIRRFEKTTGAKLGPYEYNGKLLHQWMQSNAARFLIENRGNML